MTPWLETCRLCVADIRAALERLPTRAEREPVLRLGEGGDDTTAIDQAAEDAVVMYHGFAVGAELDVAFDGEIAVDGGLRRRRHVLDDAARGIMQAAMRDRPGRQPSGGGH